MLTITKEQMKVFELAAVKRFEDEMASHLGQFHPRHSEVLGEEGVRRVIRYGIEKAEYHGFTHRGPVRFYLELMNMFGCDFDADPQFPWAAEVLNSKVLPDQNGRAERLYDKMREYIKTVVGEDREHVKSALRQLSLVNLGRFNYDPETTETEIINTLEFVYPLKCRYLGERALRNMIRQSADAARHNHCGTYYGWVLFSCLNFALGKGFPHDPMYPWITATLTNSAIDGPDKRVERLSSKAMTYLKYVLANMED